MAPWFRRDPRTGRGPRDRRGRRRAGGGQVLVIFALSITFLFAAAGLAFDVGRFYSERRFLQNAADAAALAAANALIRGDTVAEADAEARDILARNFMASPSGITPALPPVTAVYQSGHAGDADYLLNGILLPGRDTNTGRDIRVAVQNSLGYTSAQRFFLSYAQGWCVNRTDEYAKEAAKTDSHSPGKYRVNGVLLNMLAFREAFACKAGTPMAPATIHRVW